MSTEGDMRALIEVITKYIRQDGPEVHQDGPVVHQRAAIHKKDVGTLEQITVFPVKSCGGTSVRDCLPQPSDMP